MPPLSSGDPNNRIVLQVPSLTYRSGAFLVAAKLLNFDAAGSAMRACRCQTSVSRTQTMIHSR
jgi:hypothetical protein